MSKKASTAEKLGGMLLILVILFGLIVFAYQITFGAGKSPVSFIDNILPGIFKDDKKDLTTLNNLAQKNFDALFQEINNCKSTTTKDCKCKTKGFSDITSSHELQVTDSEIKLLFVENNNEITKWTYPTTELKCYTLKANIKDLTSPISVTFDNGIRLKDSKGEEQEFTANNQYILYKNIDNRICWLTNERDQSSMKEC